MSVDDNSNSNLNSNASINSTAFHKMILPTNPFLVQTEAIKKKSINERDETKRPKMGFIAASLADRIILTDDNPRNESSERILLEISNGISPELLSKVQQIPDRAQAITEAVSSSLDREIILIAGKGHEEYQIIHNDYLPFSDIGIITSLISTHFLPQDLGED